MRYFDGLPRPVPWIWCSLDLLDECLHIISRCSVSTECHLKTCGGLISTFGATNSCFDGPDESDPGGPRFDGPDDPIPAGPNRARVNQTIIGNRLRVLSVIPGAGVDVDEVDVVTAGVTFCAA